MQDTGRRIFLYDTYEGMSRPIIDKDINEKGESAINKWSESQTEKHNSWRYASLEDVKSNLSLTDYPKEKLIFVKGKVEDTISRTVPDKISILRLDTDWYESTYYSLFYLFPRLVVNGVLIIDDYGRWQCARKAVDRYL